MTGVEVPVLEAKGVSVRFPHQSEFSVRDVSLSVEPGAAIGIVGESGSGKTSLVRTLVGALAPTEGTVLVQGRAWGTVHRNDAVRRSVQMVFQDPYGSLNPWRPAVDAVTDVVRKWKDVNRGQARAVATNLLSDVGLSRDAMERRPPRLSGGQCQRVAIARALACEPRTLVADEPTSALDVSVQAQILNLLLSLRTERSLALILVSHDLLVVDYMCTDALVMRQGEVVERGTTQKLLHAPSHPYTKLLIDSAPGSWRLPRETQRPTPEVSALRQIQ